MIRASTFIVPFLLAQVAASQAFAQAAGNDIEVQGSDILKVCREIHRAPQAQEPAAIATAQGITFNCRLINSNGSTLAQVSPEDVCERLTGSREWYRGAGTQVFCAAEGAKSRAARVPCPQPTDEQIFSEDVTRACQNVHRTGNASAEPLRMSVNGPEFNCRLVNSAGFTIAGVSLEQVCEVKTGRSQWCYTETSSYCRGADYVEPNNPGPNPLPGPGPGPEVPGPEKPKVEEAPPEPKAGDIQFCKPKTPGGEVVVKITREGEKRTGYEVIIHPMVTCGSGQGMPPEKLCPSLTGNTAWYLSANGFRKTQHGIIWPDWIAVCRGTGARERMAFADVPSVCKARGWLRGTNGITQNTEPLCFNTSKQAGYAPINIADVCSTLYNSSSWKQIGINHWCLP